MMKFLVVFDALVTTLRRWRQNVVNAEWRLFSHADWHSLGWLLVSQVIACLSQLINVKRLLWQQRLHLQLLHAYTIIQHSSHSLVNLFLSLSQEIHLHCVHEKAVTCIRCHNSGKQSWIVTKFYANTETLNCKVTKFQQNRAISATSTASLVRSLKSISVHYRHRRDCVCVQNVHRVLAVERKLEDVDATAWPLCRWPPGGNVPTLRSGATSAGRRHESGCGTHDPVASTKSGSRLG